MLFYWANYVNGLIGYYRQLTVTCGTSVPYFRLKASNWGLRGTRIPYFFKMRAFSCIFAK
jgi:hypothetical protein